MEAEQGRELELIRDFERWFNEKVLKELGPESKPASMSPEGLVEILKLIRGVDMDLPRVLELGTGLSTVVLHKADLDASIISLDHSLEWLLLMAAKLLPHFGIILPAPSMMLIPRSLKELGLYQVIIVDHGPELQTRADDLPWIVKLLAPGGTMVFDDWRPKHEGRIRRGLAKLGIFDIEVLEHTRRWDKDKAIAFARRMGS